jgi:hypothetical protein
MSGRGVGGLRIADSGQPCGGTLPAGHRARGRLYKQTQFPRRGDGAGGAIMQNKANLPAGAACAKARATGNGRSCTNKANSPLPDRQAGSRLVPSVRNKANSEQVGREPVLRLQKERPTLDQVEGRLHEEAIMQNKAKLGKYGVFGAWDAGRAQGKCAKQTQFPAHRMAQASPACAGAGSAPEKRSWTLAPMLRSPHHSSIPSFQHSSPRAGTEGQMCKTNPISGGAGRDGAAAAWNAEQMRRTKPICPALVERGGSGRGGQCRRQARETNPIPRGQAEAMDVESATVRLPHTCGSLPVRFRCKNRGGFIPCGGNEQWLAH